MPKQTKIYNGGEVSRIGVKEIFNRSVSQIKPRLSSVTKTSHSNQDVYNFQYPVRGFGIVICIENFPVARLGSRPYAQDELANMNEMLSKLEFHVMMFTDLSVQQIMDVLTEAASRKEVHENADTFACIIGSHGNELEVPKAVKDKKTEDNFQYFHHVVYGTDGPVLTSDLIDLFEDINCPGLKGKPKLFFLQACRSRFGDYCKADMGIEIGVANKTSPSKSYTNQGEDRKESAESEIRTEVTTGEVNNLAGHTKSMESREGLDSNGEGLDSNEEDISDEADDINYTDDDSLSDHDEHTITALDDSSSDINAPRDHEEKGLFSKLKKLNPFKKKKKKRRRVAVYSPYCPNHFYLMFATSEEKFAYGRDGQGGWMLHVLNEVIKQTNNFCRTDFMTLTTTVCDIVATCFQTNSASLKGAKTAVTVEHRLMKDIYFTKKIS